MDNRKNFEDNTDTESFINSKTWKPRTASASPIESKILTVFNYT